MNKKVFVGLFIALGVFAAVLFSGVVLAVPNGGSVVSVSNATAGTGAPDAHAAIAGNVSEITLSGYTTTQAWQGYFGNVSGTIQLADASSNVFYNWSQTTATGEVYASLNSSVGWSGITCFNISGEHSVQLSSLESFFNIGGSDVDGIDETFVSGTHASFETGSTSFAANACNSTQVFGPTGASTYDEIILIDTSNRTVYASILSDNTAGFDSLPHDFEMIVPEDGHAADTSTTPYYFYVELG